MQAIDGVLLALTLALQVANSGRANPIYADEGGGMRRATWDFAVPSDYYAAGVALAAGAATLAKSDGSRNYTNDAEFLAAESASNNATVRSGVRLLGNQGCDASSPIERSRISSVAGGEHHEVSRVAHQVLSQVDVVPGTSVVCIVSGGNNDVSRYGEIIERSLVHEGLKH